MASGSYLPNLKIKDLSSEQKKLYGYLEEQINGSFTAIQSKEDGALIGPFGIFLHNSKMAHAFFQANSALSSVSDLPATIREIAIIVTGVHFGAAYEVYAHSLIGEAVGLSTDTIADIQDGKKPTTLTEGESVAYDVAKKLTSSKGELGPKLWQAGRAVLGDNGMFCLVQYVGYYAWVSLVLNGFGARSPSDTEVRM